MQTLRDMHADDTGAAVIRQARPEDIPGLAALLADLFRIESDFSPDRERQERALTALIADRSGSSVVLVAARGETVAGMCSVQTVISTAEGGRSAILEDVVVLDELRGRRIGTTLLDGAIAWCRRAGITRLQLLADKDNARALDFYAARGWKPTRLTCLRMYP